MAGVTQTIPQYSAGISEQPDNLKFPGQVVESINAIPDVTKGLFKRPGAARIGTNALANVQSGGAYFHYYRDDNEGSYIGQVAADGQLRMWKADGDTPVHHKLLYMVQAVRQLYITIFRQLTQRTYNS